MLSQAAPSPPPSAAQHALAFAGALMAEGDYYRAIGEYKRYLFLSPHGPEAQAAQLAIGRAYLRGGRAEAAAGHYQAMLRRAPGDSEAALELGYARYVGDLPLLALNQLSAWEAQFGPFAPLDQRHRAGYLRGWSMISLRQYEEAARQLDAAGDFPQRADLVSATRALENLPQKSPVVAGLLSIVPGAGHLYLEQPGIALAAFSWNAVFGYALYDSIQRGQVGLALVLGVFEALWYFGTMFGAINGALKYNRDVHLNAQESLRAQYDDRPTSWPPSPPLPRDHR